jgi:spore coat protein CotH
MHKMKKKTLPVIAILLGIVLLTVPQTGCDGWTDLASANDAPFYDDRVSTVRIIMSEEDWEYSLANAAAEEYVQADFWFDDLLVPDIAVRPKGNSSLKAAIRADSPRMSLKVDFNFFNSERTFYGLKKINLNNGFSDPTLIRETLGYELFEQMGLPTPRTTFVDVWINDLHVGLYTMIEQVDKTFLSNHFDDAGGNLYKPEIPAGLLNWTEADLGEQPASADYENSLDVNLGGGNLADILEVLERMGFDAHLEGTDDMPPMNEQPPALSRGLNFLESMELKTNENNPDHTALLALLDVLNNEPDETFQTEIEKILDVDQALRFLAVSAAIVHLDNYIGSGHNYYLYEIDDKFTIIPWDLNMVFGTFNSGVSQAQLINLYIDEPTAGPSDFYPLTTRLLAVPEYLETYHVYLENFIDGPFSEEVMNTRIDELAGLIRPYVSEDDLKFFSTRQFEMSISDPLIQGNDPQATKLKAFGLKTFIAERLKSIRAQLDGTLESASGDGSGNGGRSLLGGGQRGQRPRR